VTLAFLRAEFFRGPKAGLRSC